MLLLRLPGGTSGKKKNPRANAGDRRDTCLILGLGRSPGGGMAVHSSILAWEIPWTEEPGWPQSRGLKRVRHDLVTKPPPPIFPNMFNHMVIPLQALDPFTFCFFITNPNAFPSSSIIHFPSDQYSPLILSSSSLKLSSYMTISLPRML